MCDQVLRVFGVAHHCCTDGEVEDNGDGAQRKGDKVGGGLFSSGFWFLSELASTSSNKMML